MSYSYIQTAARATSLLIRGEEYIQNLTEFVVSDSSAFRQGLLSTAGTMILSTVPGSSMEDYSRDIFKRGREVKLFVQYPGESTSELHPRGLLYIVGVNYDPETESVLVELGCQLVMKNLLERGEDLLSYSSLALDPAAQDFANISAAIATTGEILYQDNTGQLVKKAFFNDQFSSPKFYSVRGMTALQVAPLAAADAIPDEIELSFSYNTGSLAGDNQGRVDTTETNSKYYLRYPFRIRIRVPNGSSGGIGGGTGIDDIDVSVPDLVLPEIPPVYIPPVEQPTSACGNAPEPLPIDPNWPPQIPGINDGEDNATGGGGSGSGGGGGGGSGATSVVPPTSCSANFETKDDTRYLKVERNEIRVTHFDGPAAQQDYAYSEVYGPAIEASGQYYADYLSFCVQANGTACNPMGDCPYYGIENRLLGRNETRNYFGEANEVVKTVRLQYRPILAAAQPTDWRSGVVEGVVQDFDASLDSNQEMYLHSMSETTFETEPDGAKIQKTVTHTSIASRGAGIKKQLDAREGIRTEVTRRSTTTQVEADRADTVNSPTTTTETETKKYRLSVGGGYCDEFGPYTVKEDVPVPLLDDQGSERDNKAAALVKANEYANYLIKMIKGDALGLNVTEPLRKEIGRNWSANDVFHYYDDKNDILSAYRTNATTWGVGPEGCAMTTQAIFISKLSADVVKNGNVFGDGDHPSEIAQPITVTNLEPISDGHIFNVEVNLRLGLSVNYQQKTPEPDDVDVDINTTSVWWCTGLIVQPGALLALDDNGSLPLSSDGNPIVNDLLVVNEDLFASTP